MATNINSRVASRVFVTIKFQSPFYVTVKLLHRKMSFFSVAAKKCYCSANLCLDGRKLDGGLVSSFYPMKTQIGRNIFFYTFFKSFFLIR